MAEVLMETCSPPLTSSYSHLSHQLDWHQHRPGIPVVSISPYRSPIKDIRTASESSLQVSRGIFSGHDQGISFRANKQLPLPRDTFSLITSIKDVPKEQQVDDVDMGGSAQPSKRQERPRRQDVEQQRSRADTSSAHTTDSDSSILSSNSTSPVRAMATPQLTLTGATNQGDGEQPEKERERGEELVGTPEEEGEDVPAEPAAMTAAERLAEKRKMKRFRLTHVQTRLLNAEFARQPHPDAAERDRLSRLIEGFSPRQVQVWFQNRRAKNKRLSSDDQESMIRSRALPAGFDLSQTLRPSGSEPAPGANYGSSGGVVGGVGRQGVTPIDMSLVYGAISKPLNFLGSLSSVSLSSSFPSANASPMFGGSPNSSPFVQSGGDSFPRLYNPANLGFPTQGNYRARSGSLMSLSASSPSLAGSPLVHPRASVSTEDFQAGYQQPYLSELSNLSMASPSLGDSPHGHPQPRYMGTMPSPSLLPSPSYRPSSLRRDSSATRSSTMPLSAPSQAFASPSFFPGPSQEQFVSPYEYQPSRMQRRQTQPSFDTSLQQSEPAPAALRQMAAYAASLPLPPQARAMGSYPLYAQSLNAQPPSPFHTRPPPSPFHAQPPSPASPQVSPTGTYQQQPEQQQQLQQGEQDFNDPRWAGLYLPQPDDNES